RDVSTPVFFAIATTVATFGPLLFVPGFMGKVFSVIPIIVIAVLFISLVESIYVLPAHLAHSSTSQKGFFGGIFRQQQKLSQFLERSIETVYVPLARLSARYRYVTLALALSSMIIMIGASLGGVFKFSFMPKLQSDFVTATVRLPLGTPLTVTRGFRDRLQKNAAQVLAEMGQGKSVHHGVLSVAGGTASRGGGPGGNRGGASGSHLAQVRVNLKPMGVRTFSSEEFSRKWRAAVGDLVGVEKLSFRYSFGGSGENPISIRLSHANIEVLESSAQRLADQLGGIDGITNVDAGFSPGKEQLNVKLSDQGRAMGLTERELAVTLRSAYYGTEALRQQRGRDEIRVLVR
ncbi:MAG TPA: efflux RND transporter permease subunit, partial [Myxococcales bacterium]|nr:efflux RND transporter permease subunit [Myxococcales bacterium]